MALPSRARRALSTAVLLGAGTLLGLLLAEAAVRWLMPQPLQDSGRMYQADAELGHRLKAGYDGVFSDHAEFRTRVRTNHLGLRGPDPGTGRPRVLGLGDSFLFGYGVEDDQTFLALAAARIGASPLNGGVPAYGTCQEVGLGQRLIPELSPEAIVLGVFLGNDEPETASSPFLRVEDGELFAPGAGSRLRFLTHPLYARLHLLRLLRTSPPVQRLQAFSGKPPVEQQAFRELLDAYTEPAPENVLSGSARMADCLGQLAALARERNTPLLAVVIPEYLEVHAADVAAVARRAAVTVAGIDIDGPRRRVLAALAAHGVPALDVRPALRRQAGRGRIVYFPKDRHLTREGHLVVAEELAGVLALALSTR